MAEEKKNPLGFPTRVNPSLEHLLGAVIRFKEALSLLRERHAQHPEKLRMVESCCRKLAMIEASVLRRGCSRKVFMAWSLVHQLDEELFLFMEPEELLAEGRNLLLEIQISSLPEVVRKDWSERLAKQLDRLEAEAPERKVVEQSRYLIRMALNALNSHVDTLFWDIWAKKFSGLIYTVLLLAGLATLGWLLVRPGELTIGIALVLLLGGMGGAASGVMSVMSAEPQYWAKGHFWVSTLYYSLVRPTQGALAAIIVFWMLQSPYLIQINPPLGQAVRATTTSSGPPTTVAVAPTAQPKETLIVLNASQGNQHYLYFLLLLLAGFSGDKLLKSVSDKTLNRLFSAAEKTKEA